MNTRQNIINSAFLYGANANYIEELYQQYLVDKSSVDPKWHIFFSETPSDRTKVTSWKAEHTIVDTAEYKNNHVNDIAQYYRRYGHLLTNLDPLKLEKSYYNNQSAPESFVPDSSSKYNQIYAGSIAVEFEHVAYDEQQYLYKTFEDLQLDHSISKEQQESMLNSLVEVEGLEQYLHIKFPGAKRFSIEGGESAIVAMETAINEAAKCGVEEVVVGMAHRGRLNTLTKVMGKPYEALFAEFAGKSSFPDELHVAGDVKYHMGYSGTKVYGDHNIRLSLTPNPSHLEAVNTVVAGRVRAKQDLRNDAERKTVMALLVHGDAAFCGQGIVAEGLQMSTLKPYDVGGIVHIVINNQVGFTANPVDGHAKSRYSTEFAKIIGAPIVHVNGDDVEAVCRAAVLIASYRNKFNKDVVLEVMCYRKYGHNEGDEPMYTQPIMYSAIKHKDTPAAVYAKSLVEKGVIHDGRYVEFKHQFKVKLDEAFAKSESYVPKVHFLEGVWSNYTRHYGDDPDTGVDKKILASLAQSLASVPEGFALNPKLEKQFHDRKNAAAGNDDIDYGCAESLAFASLLSENINIRITGQDAGRGTFSHRHSVVFDQQNGQKYIPLNNIGKHLGLAQGSYEVADSNLSEYGVLGFEFGYSLAKPQDLVIWEAQFGDFANGAQIIFDQFLSGCETKWVRLSGLVVLLPHGYEGQGPEHTSARLERFLQLSAENNMQIACPTTPASIFHLLRRQVIRKIRKPLIVMTPKSLLRHKLAVSNISDLEYGTRFNAVIPETYDVQNVKKILICSGKIYYDLVEKRLSSMQNDVAIVRVEQLYPFPLEEIMHEIAKYPSDAQIIWCQEEAENMGAWSFVCSRFGKELRNQSGEITYIGRPYAASPAVGYLSVHKKEQEALVRRALQI